MPRNQSRGGRGKIEESSSDSSEVDFMGLFQGGEQFFNPNFSREFTAKLPQKIRDRVRLLSSFDEEYAKDNLKMERENEAVLLKYEKLFAPFFQRRKEIVTGTGREVSEDEVMKGLPGELIGKIDVGNAATLQQPADEKGIPHFWLDALCHHVIIRDMISERDEALLQHLIDISYATLEDGFTLSFYFEPNDFIEENVLKKTIFLKVEGSSKNVQRTSETTIRWKDGKDLTVEIIIVKPNKKQRGRGKSKSSAITKTVPCESFFNFFKPCDPNSEDGEQWCALATTIYTKIAPFAVNYATGEAPDGGSDIDDDEEDSEDEEESLSSEERGGGGRKGGRGRVPSGSAKAKECTQQ